MPFTLWGGGRSHGGRSREAFQFGISLGPHGFDPHAGTHITEPPHTGFPEYRFGPLSTSGAGKHKTTPTKAGADTHIQGYTMKHGWRRWHTPSDTAWWPYANERFGSTFAEIVACGVDCFLDDLDEACAGDDTEISYYLPDAYLDRYDKTFYLKMRSVSHRLVKRMHVNDDIAAHMPIEEIIGRLIVAEAEDYVDVARDASSQFPKRVINAVGCLEDFLGDWYGDTDVNDLWDGPWGGEYDFDNWFKPMFWNKHEGEFAYERRPGV